MIARATLCGLLGLVVLAAPAHATLYCVPSNANGCSGTVSPNLQSALDSAEAAGDDVIHIQPGTYTGNFVYDPSIANAGTLFIDERTSGVTLRSNSGTTLALQPDSVDSDTRIDRVRIQAPDGGIASLVVAALPLDYACEFTTQERRHREATFSCENPGFAERFFIQGESDVSGGHVEYV